MVPCATALALCLALLLACPAHGEELASPQGVRFAAEVARHLLRWQPGHRCPSDARYEVEYKVYGSSIPWTAVPECRNTSERSCDLTHYTLDLEKRYYARVRAVSGGHTSPWRRSSPFSPQEASLRLAGQSLSVLGNSIRVRLQPLLHPGSITPEHRELQQRMARYLVYVRRTRDNHTFTVVESSPEFTIGELFWVTEYCLSVEPSLAHRPAPGTRGDETCVTTAHRDWSSELVPGVLSSSLVILGLLGALLAHIYVKKPVRTPSVLKSFMKQSSLWVEQEPPSSGQDADPIQQLFLGQKEPQAASSPDSSSSTAQLPLEQAWGLPAWPKDQLSLLGQGRDSSGTSTDSGICLHIPSSSSSSSSLSCSAGPEPQGYRQQLPRAEESREALGSPCPAPGCSSGSPELGEVEFRGYLQQSRGTVEPEQPPEKGVPLSGSAGPALDAVLDVEGSELAVSKGYLKQSCPQQPLTEPLAPWGAPARALSSQMGPPAPTLLSWAPPAAAPTPKASPELKTPSDLNIFSSAALLGTWPLVPSPGPSWIPAPIPAPSWLGGDGRDSRL